VWAALAASSWPSGTCYSLGLLIFQYNLSPWTNYAIYKLCFVGGSDAIRNLLYATITDCTSWNHDTYLSFSAWDAILSTVKCPPMKRRQGSYWGLPAFTVQAENMGMIFGQISQFSLLHCVSVNIRIMKVDYFSHPLASSSLCWRLVCSTMGGKIGNPFGMNHKLGSATYSVLFSFHPHSPLVGEHFCLKTTQISGAVCLLVTTT
jgi:hypothetical protein